MTRVAGDLELPSAGVSLPVTWNDQCFGYLVAVPMSDVVVTAEQRRIAA